MISAARSRTPDPVAGWRAAGWAAVALLLFGQLWLGFRFPAGLPASRDVGAGSTPAWLGALLVLVVVAVTRLSPPRLAAPRLRSDGSRRATVLLVAGLLLIEAAFVLSWWFPPLLGEADYVLWKVLLLGGAGGLAVLLTRGRGSWVRLIAPASGWWPVLPLLVLGLGLLRGPTAHRMADPGLDPVTLVVYALVTALTAGVLEEVFFRGWLQTRLQVLGGPLPALLLSSLAFAAMHLGSHQNGLPAVDAVASVLANQGLIGILLGHLRLRYGRLWPCICAHIGLNGLAVVAYLLGLG